MSARCVKSFSICSVAASLALVAAVALAGPPEGMDTVDLTNFQLSPQYSQWLLGPISWMASPQEVRTYLGLADDAAAESFIEAFWAQRSNPDSPWPTDQPRVVFQQRAAQADTRFSEGTRYGRWTDRGTIYVLYGEPEKTYYEVPERPRSPRPPDPVEVWSYPKDAAKGLDGERPRRKYFFVKRGDTTVFNGGR